MMSDLWVVLLGVLEELWVDVGDGLWLLLDTVGLGSLLLQLRRELAAASPSRRKSIVRVLGSVLPLRPVERPYLRYVALRSLSTSCDSLCSAHTQGQIDTRWLTDTERSIKCRPILSRCETAPELFPLCADNENPPRSSTPFSVTSDFGPPHYRPEPSDAQNENFYHSGLQHSTLHAASPFTNPSALAKISALEDELAQLRSQIAGLMNQAHRPATPPPSPVPSMAPPPPPPPPPPHLLPPPPPPPPPPVRLSSVPAGDEDSRKPSFSDLIAQNKSSINKHVAPIDVPVNTSSSSTPVSMTDVLKGLNKVKLKRVSRSPGGTPVRSRPKSPLPGDTAAIIAAALKKRFAKMHSDSPEKEICEGSNEFSSSPETTPQAKRKSRVDLPKRKLIEEDGSPAQNFLKVLKKPSPKVARPKPKEEEEKPSLPIFGQHLLKKRAPRPPESRESVSPSSEASDLSR